MKKSKLLFIDQETVINRSSVLLLLILMLFSVEQLLATSYYVNDNSSSGDLFCTAIGSNANNGISPATPKATLTDLLLIYGPAGSNSLTSGDIIYVDAGLYFETDRNLTLSTNGLSIIGAGNQLTSFNNNMASAGSNRLFTITADNIYLANFSLTGYNRGSDAFAIQFESVSNNVVDNVLLFGNNASSGSSAIVINGGSEVTFNGGGSSCNPSLLVSAVAGGGVNVEGNGNNVTFNNYGFSNNSKDFQGGSGLYINGDNTTSVTVTNFIFSNNENSGIGGGAIFVSNGASLAISGSCFNGNQANQTSGTNYGGAILLGEGSTININNCSFDSNQATSSGNGGAIAVYTAFGSGGAASITISQTSFLNNSAPDGADLYTEEGFSDPAQITCFECTFSGTTEDVLQDEGVIELENSGSPSGTYTVIDTDAATLSPSTACPVMLGDCYSSPLPIELLDFDGECHHNSIALNWSTVSEKNNDYFVLERSKNGQNFEQIATLEGQGNSQEVHNYTFNDYDFLPGISYFRLTQVDFDGRFETFDIIALQNDCIEGEDLRAHFDQSSQKIKLFHGIKARDIKSIVMFSINGQAVYVGENHSTTNLGYSEITLLKELVDGIYIIELETIYEVKNVKIIIQ